MNSPNLDLAGRVALVTGAGQNVGRQIALHLAAHGAGGVVVNDYFAERAEQVAAEIGAHGGKAIGVQADITRRDAVKEMVERARSEFGRDIEILVNNAGNAGAEPTANARKPFWETGHGRLEFLSRRQSLRSGQLRRGCDSGDDRAALRLDRHHHLRRGPLGRGRA